MNYREKIRKAIECPQFRDKRYGEWGILNLKQRSLIKRLLNELDSADNCVKKLYLENIKKKEVIDKTIEKINDYKIYCKENKGLTEYTDIEIEAIEPVISKLEDILKEVSE